MDCDIKTKVLHQSIGVIRGLEIAKESLNDILESIQRTNEQMTTDEWLLRDQQIKRQIEQIDTRGGLAQYIDDGMAGRL